MQPLRLFGSSTEFASPVLREANLNSIGFGILLLSVVLQKELLVSGHQWCSFTFQQKT